MRSGPISLRLPDLKHTTLEAPSRAVTDKLLQRAVTVGEVEFLLGAPDGERGIRRHAALRCATPGANHLHHPTHQLPRQGSPAAGSPSRRRGGNAEAAKAAASPRPRYDGGSTSTTELISRHPRDVQFRSPKNALLDGAAKPAARNPVAPAGDGPHRGWPSLAAARFVLDAIRAARRTVPPRNTSL
jgi:hypothetical protein